MALTLLVFAIFALDLVVIIKLAGLEAYSTKKKLYQLLIVLALPIIGPILVLMMLKRGA